MSDMNITKKTQNVHKCTFEQFWSPSYVTPKLTSARFELDCVKFFFFVDLNFSSLFSEL